MKKIFLLILTIFLFTAIGYAQSKDSSITRVIWDKDMKCSDLNLPSVQNESLQCFEQQDKNGVTFYMLYYNNVLCAISFRNFDNKIVAGVVQINNNSGKPIFIDVKKSYIADYVSKDSFRENEKSKASNYALSARKIVDKILYRENPASVTSLSPAPNAGVRTQTRQSTEGATRGMTVIEPASPQSNPSSAIDRRTPANSSNRESQPTVTTRRGKTTRYKQMIETALVSKSLDDKDKTVGILYFKRFKNAGYRAVFVRIGDLEFVFPSS